METVNKQIIKNFIQSVENGSLKGNSLFLATPNGVICGNVCSRFDNRPIAKAFWSLVENVNTNSFDNNPDNCIYLTNAKIKDGPSTINVGDMIIFYDQVVGVTIGNF